jgi:hypothetical protein
MVRNRVRIDRHLLSVSKQITLCKGDVAQTPSTKRESSTQKCFKQTLMENQLYNKPHRREYLLYGALAAIGYLLFVIIFLANNHYENSYLLYFGNILFFVVIAIHAIKVVNRRHEGKSAVRSMIASHLSAVVGVILAALGSILVTYLFFGNLGSGRNPDQVYENANASSQVERPSGLLVNILIYATVVNFAVSAFFSVLISYVWKKNQTRDKPAELDRNIHVIEK